MCFMPFMNYLVSLHSHLLVCTSRMHHAIHKSFKMARCDRFPGHRQEDGGDGDAQNREMRKTLKCIWSSEERGGLLEAMMHRCILCRSPFSYQHKRGITMAGATLPLVFIGCSSCLRWSNVRLNFLPSSVCVVLCKSRFRERERIFLV